MLVIALVIGTFVAVASAVVIVLVVLVVHNAKKADELSKLNTQMEASKILQDALNYLTPMGTGNNLEWTNAREIIELALTRVMFE